ncbi:MAG: hypothetical protein J7D61_17400, partial [Marichromatium sp.]|nr:hypothetical protein [Marichromatium sp.]
MSATIGFVTQITGIVQAVAADGSVRVLAMGDPIYANETIQTVGTGSSANVLFEDGRQIMMASNEEIILDETVYSGEGYAQEEVALIQETLMNEGELEEAAAGEEGPASDGGSTDAFVAERTGELGDVQSY